MCCNGNEALGKKTCILTVQTSHTHHRCWQMNEISIQQTSYNFRMLFSYRERAESKSWKKKTKPTETHLDRKHFVMSEKKPYDNVEFDWIQLSADLDPSKTESFLNKWKRKFGENPFVPIGKCDAIIGMPFEISRQWKKITTFKIAFPWQWKVWCAAKWVT